MVATKSLLETSQHHTAPLWPRYVPNRSPLCAYHAVGVWSLAQENSKSPSLLYLRNVSGLSCPFNKIGLISPLSFPTKPASASEFTKWSPQNPNRNSQVILTRCNTELRRSSGKALGGKGRRKGSTSSLWDLTVGFCHVSPIDHHVSPQICHLGFHGRVLALDSKFRSRTTIRSTQNHYTGAHKFIQFCFVTKPRNSSWVIEHLLAGS